MRGARGPSKVCISVLTSPRSARSDAEFIALVALTTSLVAMGIDTMLPALGALASELGVSDPNDRQWVLTAFFAGLSLGQLVWGPVSDSTGRKPALYAGLGLYIAGGLLCAAAGTFTQLTWGRALAGFGAASPRVVALAMVRDRYAGRAMARLMSFVTAVFILVPIVAPAVGQTVLLFAGWRAIFYGLMAAAAVDLIWLVVRQPETLPRERRAAFSLRAIMGAARATSSHRITLGYMLAAGCVFAPFMAYLATAQQIFQEQYGLGPLFPAAFGALALSIGLASLVNAKLVMRFGMRVLSGRALLASCGISWLFLFVTWRFDGRPPLSAFMAYMLLCFFCQGILFGNYSARAMEPMGHVAGVAAAITSAMTSFVALAIGTPVGRAYDGTVLPLVATFASVSLCALALTETAERGAT